MAARPSPRIRIGWREPLEPNAVGFGELVFVGEGGDQGLGAPISDRHRFGPEPLGGGGDVDRRVAGADHQYVRADHALGERLRVGLENEVERFPDTLKLLALDTQRQGPAQPDAQEDRVVVC